MYPLIFQASERDQSEFLRALIIKLLPSRWPFLVYFAASLSCSHRQPLFCDFFTSAK